MEPIPEGHVFEVADDENEIEFSERPSERGFHTIAPVVHPPGHSFCLSQPVFCNPSSSMAMPVSSVSENSQAWPLESFGLAILQSLTYMTCFFMFSF